MDSFPYYSQTPTERASKRSRVGQAVSQATLHRDATGARDSVFRDPRSMRAVARAKEGSLAEIGRYLPNQAMRLPDAQPCSKCGAHRFAYEPPKFCCGNGDVWLPSNDYPPELFRLFTSKDEDALHFQKYARLYNNLFAFSSIGGKIDAQTQKGIYVFKLHGQVYHFVPNLLPDNDSPKYLQLYFYDVQHEAENRVGCFPELRQDVVDILMNITQSNPYANFFLSLKEVQVNEDTQIILNKNTIPDQRVYNAPTSDKVAAIWTDSSSSSESCTPHIMVFGKSDESHRIMHYYGFN